MSAAEETLEEETGADIIGSDDSEDSEDDYDELLEESEDDEWDSKYLISRFLNMFHSEILASLNINKIKILSPELENNHTPKCCSGNFPT